MKIENLTEEEIKDIILKKQLEWIKLCQDNFLVFAETVWQDFIYRKTKDFPNKIKGIKRGSIELEKPERSYYYTCCNIVWNT